MFDTPITTEIAYRLICTMGEFKVMRSSVYAREYLRTQSWYGDICWLQDFSYIYRNGSGFLIHTVPMHAGKTAQSIVHCLHNNIPFVTL